MKRRYTLLIADGNNESLYAATEALEKTYQITRCSDGNKALELLRKNQYDLVVMNLMLPQLDGLTLLEILSKEHIYPTVLAVTPNVSEYVRSTAENLGIIYMIRIPFEARWMTLLIQNLLDYPKIQRFSQCDARFVSRLLSNLGIFPGNYGYTVLLNAILIAADSPTSISMTKELYPAVGKLCDLSATCVEHMIRITLSKLWPGRNIAAWETQFPRRNTRPTNAQFILTLAQELRFHREEQKDFHRTRFLPE